MRILAAPGDTWGIPGTTFLLGYAVLVGVSIWLAIALRRGVARGPAAESLLPVSDPFALALLTGGPLQAVQAAIAGLRARHLVTAAAGGGVAASRPPNNGLHPLENAVHRAIAGGRRHVWMLLADDRVRSAVGTVRKDLEQAGLVLTGPQRVTYRLLGLLPAPVLLLGAVRFLDGAAAGKPVGYLTMLLIVVIVVQIMLLLSGPPEKTRAGKEAVRSEIRRHDHLKPELNPSWGAYGAVGAAMGVALFGTAALYAADPAFAAESEIRRAAAAGSSSSSSSGTGDSGSSCSSSSSCSSGSSCGGGGCGGGGCGG
ncbi:TIGR04222 domain-containing membrane protein [Cryptosporangium minutisporangium]|uniref:TIGR04222 domain-containing membrane protein n=1 Tax=Cryptosporangium minutisporangium TaxID=113569 RepID=A0ABP6T1U9_9ACTN